MARLKKWGNRGLRLPSFNPRFPGRSSVFKSKPSRATAKSPRMRFEAKRSRGPMRVFSKPEGKKTVAGGNTRKPRSRRKFWLITSLIIIVLILQALRYVELHMKPPIQHLAHIRVKQIATESINKAITSQVADGGNAEELIDWKTDKNGKISGFMLNYAEHMRITSQAAEVIQTTLQDLHNRTEHIPLGQALGSPLIASYGPNIPIKIEPQGAVKVELNTRQKNAGINMILVEVYIHIVTEVAVVIPFDMEPQIVDTEIPVSYLMVVGDVPMYYYDNQGQPVGANGNSAPGIAIPAPSGSGDKNGAVDQSKDNTNNSQNDSSQNPAATHSTNIGTNHTEENQGENEGN